MIKYTDLRFGNLVSVSEITDDFHSTTCVVGFYREFETDSKNYVEKVQVGNGKTYLSNEIYPILINDTWLQIFEFIQYYGDTWIFTDGDSKELLIHNFQEVSFDTDKTNSIPCKYVHELQNICHSISPSSLVERYMRNVLADKDGKIISQKSRISNKDIIERDIRECTTKHLYSQNDMVSFGEFVDKITDEERKRPFDGFRGRTPYEVYELLSKWNAIPKLSVQEEYAIIEAKKKQ